MYTFTLHKRQFINLVFPLALLHNGEHAKAPDAAIITGACDAHVALLAPRAAPLIFQTPVLLASLRICESQAHLSVKYEPAKREISMLRTRAITDSEDDVVGNDGVALPVRVDALMVEREGVRRKG